MKKILFLFFLFTPLFYPNKAEAEENQFITIVNPVRIAWYTQDPEGAVAAQYRVVSEKDLPATWLFTYDALVNDGVYSIARTMDGKQEFGLFLEVSPAFAEAAGVEYHDTGSWHHSNSVFFSGYTQEERIKLIDTIFQKFEERFGYFPASVGSWWTDGFSLSYMKEKYGITANLGVADQFSTDNYQVWGQYWSTPFYPSKYHPGIPAPSEDIKLDLVAFQWAARDPYNGYFSSLYSTQDYKVNPVNQDTSYFEKLVELYAKKHGNEFGQITVGLEGDLSPEAYQGEFAKQMEVAKKLSDSGEVRVTNMREFSDWYRRMFPDLSPPHKIETTDLLGKNIKITWYQSPRYRVGVVEDFEEGKTIIIDFRTYHKDLVDPYFWSPNGEIKLSIYIPPIFDRINNGRDIWRAPNNLFEGIEYNPDKLKVFIKADLPLVLENHQAIEVVSAGQGFEIIPRENWITPREGIVLRALTPEATHFLNQRRVTAAALATAVLFLIVVLGSLRLGRGGLFLSALIVIPALAFPVYWYRTNSTSYYISQAEVDALTRLSSLPEGKVLVFDNECLQCSWHTAYKPAVYANKRSYVQRIGKHLIIYNASILTAKDREKARKEFEKLNAKYIYLVKYEDYIEKLPFSPGDLNVEKIYENANAQLWQVKEN